MPEQRNYFGILKNDKAIPSKKEELEALLLSKGLFHNIYSVTLSKKPQRVFTPLEPPQPKPTKGLVNGFYNHVLRFYQNDIDSIYYQFFLDFNDEIFGLELKEQKHIALGYFKRLSKSILTTAIKFFHVEKTQEGIEQVKNVGWLQTLDGQREALKHNLAQLSGLISYLKGDNNEQWISDLFKKEKELDDFLNFEAILKILVNLNGTYDFQKNKDLNNFKETRIKSSKENQPEKELDLPKKKGIKKVRISDKEATEYLINKVFINKEKN